MPRLPDYDDLSLLASIRRATPEAQVIMMTAFGRPDMVRAALELGAYWHRTLRCNLFTAAVRKVCENIRRRVENFPVTRVALA
jgi:DNA-binding NarL/FixJ family response regulator